MISLQEWKKVKEEIAKWSGKVVEETLEGARKELCQDIIRSCEKFSQNPKSEASEALS